MSGGGGWVVVFVMEARPVYLLFTINGPGCECLLGHVCPPQQLKGVCKSESVFKARVFVICSYCVCKDVSCKARVSAEQ